MATEGVPRLILNAFCTTCGNIAVEDQSVAAAQHALDHVAETKHVVVLNGTADIVQDSDESDLFEVASEEQAYAGSIDTRSTSSDVK